MARSVAKCGVFVVGADCVVIVMVYLVAAQTMTRNAMTSKLAGTLGGRLRQARADAGYSVTRLARELDVDPRTVTRWQADQAVPTVARLGDIARVLGKPTSFFLVEP